MVNKNYELQKAYETYIKEVLKIVQKKLDIIVTFRLGIGEKKLKKLEKEK